MIIRICWVVCIDKLPGSPGRSMYCSFTLDNASMSMSKNAIHVVLSAALWVAPRSALNDCGSSSSMTDGGSYFLGFFAYTVYAAGVLISVFLRCL